MSNYLLKHPLYDLAVTNLLGLTSTLMHIKQDSALYPSAKTSLCIFSKVGLHKCGVIISLDGFPLC